MGLELVVLLQQYKGDFDSPLGLPPPRSQDHCIPLIKGSGSVKVKPYKYLHSQKEQIGIMIQQMLQEGIIQPSRNPFSLLVLLVRKKDATWRFCIDYKCNIPSSKGSRDRRKLGPGARANL